MNNQGVQTSQTFQTQNASAKSVVSGISTSQTSKISRRAGGWHWSLEYPTTLIGITIPGVESLDVPTVDF